MSAAAPNPSSPIVVHGLLVCRNVVAGEEGCVNLENVLEVIAVDALPGDAGPLTFVAFLRNVPLGPAEVAFVIRPAGAEPGADGAPIEIARLPLQVDITDAFEGRQVALRMQIPQVPIEKGGWFDVVFEWEGKQLAANRFAIGARNEAPSEPTA